MASRRRLQPRLSLFLRDPGVDPCRWISDQRAPWLGEVVVETGGPGKARSHAGLFRPGRSPGPPGVAPGIQGASRGDARGPGEAVALREIADPGDGLHGRRAGWRRER